MARQRGAIVKRYNRYSVKYRTPDGKQKWESGFETKGAAQARLNELLREIDQGSYVEPKTITFAEFAEEWLKSRSSIRGSTLSAYASIVKQQLVPYFGAMRLTDIGYQEVQTFVDKLRGNVSAKTVHNTVILLRVMLTGKKGASAVKRGFLRSDPTKGVELPARPHGKVQPLAVDTVWKLIDAAEEVGGVARPMVFVDAFTGLRRNELLAVRFDDVDWRNHELLVRNAVSKKISDDGAHKWLWGIGPPKSQKSLRRVALAPAVVELLGAMREQSDDPQALIFRRADGSMIDPDYFDAWIFAPVLERSGLQDVRFHDLRHFFASMLIAQGESPKYVCDQMGHSSIQVTFDIYGHLFPQSRRQAAEKFQEAMLEGKTKANGSSLVAGQNKSRRKCSEVPIRKTGGSK